MIHRPQLLTKTLGEPLQGYIESWGPNPGLSLALQPWAAISERLRRIIKKSN
jgi:hypothetical protein